MELTQDVVQHRAVVKLHLGVFGHHAVVAGKRGAKGAQALATGIHRAQRFAEKQDGLESFFHQMFGGGGGGLALSSPTTSQAKSGILRSISTIGRADCCRRFRPSSRMPTALTTIPSTR